jgi:L-ascorbate metabolism protein UlaG (beta-lactamase superfamily)
MKFKWFGTATILLEQDGTQLLFDPYFPLNDKIFKPPMNELASIDNIFVTHGHFDHIVDIPSVLKHGSGKSMVYCTAKPLETLLSKGVDKERIHKIEPGDVIKIGPFEVRVFKGKHVVFNMGLIIKTLFRPDIFTYRNNLKHLLKANKECSEAGETVVYDINVGGSRVFLMGSLNLDDNTNYPKGADLLIMPFQGRSDLSEYAIPIIERLQPKKVLLDHFDNSFPPMSSSVDPQPFIKNMQQKYPNVPVICPQASAEWVTPV